MKPATTLLASDATGLLTAGLAAAGTSFVLDAGYDDFPDADFTVEINDETIVVGSRSGHTFSSLTRANPVPHNTGDAVYHVQTGAQLAAGLSVATVIAATPAAQDIANALLAAFPGVFTQAS